MSMRFASAGTGATPALPMAVIFPPEIMIVWSAFAAAPVPSITRTCSSAITGDCTRMKSFMVGCGGGWAKPLAQQTTIRTMSKRRIEEASSPQEPCSIIACCISRKRQRRFVVDFFGGASSLSNPAPVGADENSPARLRSDPAPRESEDKCREELDQQVSPALAGRLTQSSPLPDILSV